jgi:hypothetical protein
MDAQPITIDEVRYTLDQLRKDPKTKRRFPRKLWDSIIQLTKTNPLGDICRQLAIHPGYLKHKIKQSKSNEFEFRELTFPAHLSTNEITIELSSHIGLKAVVRGPISSLDCLYTLFRR